MAFLEPRNRPGLVVGAEWAVFLPTLNSPLKCDHQLIHIKVLLLTF